MTIKQYLHNMYYTLYTGCTALLGWRKDKVYGAFTSQLMISHFSQSTIKTVNSLLFSEMTNLRKKDMERAMGRWKAHEEGTTITLETYLNHLQQKCKIVIRSAYTYELTLRNCPCTLIPVFLYSSFSFLLSCETLFVVSKRAIADS